MLSRVVSTKKKVQIFESGGLTSYQIYKGPRPRKPSRRSRKPKHSTVCPENGAEPCGDMSAPSDPGYPKTTDVDNGRIVEIPSDDAYSVSDNEPLPDTTKDPQPYDEFLELIARASRAKEASGTTEGHDPITAPGPTSRNRKIDKLSTDTKLTGEKLDNLVTKQMYRVLDTLMKHGKVLFDLLADESKPQNPRRIRRLLENLDQKIEQEISKLDDRRIRLNRTRAPPLQFNWDEAAESVYPTETIQVADAPPVPKSVREAITGRYAKYFLRAMLVEIESLKEKGVWEETLPPGDRNVIRSQWVFDYKTNPYGAIERFKARLVAVGSSQVENRDYTETHSPVVKMKAVRILLAMSALLGIHIDQIDVETAYLYGDLNETNYMHLPKGFEQYSSDGRPLVAKLKKALYGLHQSGREWYFTLRDYLISEGFEEFKSEPCAFWKVDPTSGQLILLLIYVDDILISSNDKGAIQKVKDRIRSRFNIKDMGSAQWILKIRIQQVGDGIFLNQEQYVIETLKYFDMWDIPESSWKDTPMVTNWEHVVSSPDLDERKNSAYATLVAKLIYLSQLTRPDIMYTVNTLAQFQRPAKECDWKAAMRLLQYMRKTYDWGLYYNCKGAKNQVIVFKSEFKIGERPMGFEIPEGYYPRMATDASYGQEFDRKSRSAYVFMVFGCLVSWYSKKQPTTALSSTEAEINALVEGIKEAEWMMSFLGELGFNCDEAVVSEQDNQSVIAIAENPIHHARIKHIEIKTHYIREKIENKLVKLVYCPTEDMVADLLTKALPSSQHHKLSMLIGMRSGEELVNGKRKNMRLNAQIYE